MLPVKKKKEESKGEENEHVCCKLDTNIKFLIGTALITGIIGLISFVDKRGNRASGLKPDL